MSQFYLKARWLIWVFSVALLGLTFPARAVVVTFPDTSPENAIRQAISKPTGDILDTDLLGLTTINAYVGGGITDLSGMEYCINLAYLDLSGNEIDNLSPLAGLTSLVHLELPNNQIGNLDPLAGLASLDYLDLTDNQISDLDPLAGLTSLTHLELPNNQIHDVAPLTDLTGLTVLNLHSSMDLVDLSPLAGLTSLTSLDLSGNHIAEVAPLLGNAGLGAGDSIWLDGNPLSPQAVCNDIVTLEARGATVYHDPCTAVGVTFPDPHLESAIRQAIGKPAGLIFDSDLEQLSSLQAPEAGIANLSGIEYCVYLHNLRLQGNQISDLSPLAGLTSLTWVTLSDNQIADPSPLAGLPYLDWLYLDGNQIADLSQLTDLPRLRELYLDNNQIVNLSPLASLTSIEDLDLGENQIADLGPLSSLTHLMNLDLRDNQIAAISPLLANTGLGPGDHIVLNGNPLLPQACIDIGVLEERGAGVSYDPCDGGEGEGESEGESEFVFTETPHSGQYKQGGSLLTYVAFSVAVGVPQIQWTKNGADIPEETYETFSINPLTVDDTAAYRVRVTDNAGAHVSPPAIITVTGETEGARLPAVTLLMLLLMLAVITVVGSVMLPHSQ